MLETNHSYKPTYLNKELFQILKEDITQFRTLFKLPLEPTNLDLTLHASLFTEELLEGFCGKTRVDKIDGAVDSVYVLMGYIVNCNFEWEDLLAKQPIIVNILDTLIQTGDVLHFSFESAWDIVHKSNLSKLCTDLNIEQTMAYYSERGVPTTATVVGIDPNNEAQSLFAVKAKVDCLGVDGTPITAGKVLKSVFYTPADLSKL